MVGERSPARRLLAFVLGLTLAVGGLELLVRVEEPLFAAASHRVLTKAAFLEARGPVDVLFFGTSRSWDGIAPSLVSAELRARTGRDVVAFNLASTASSLETLEYLVERFAPRPGVKLAVIELSAPQLARAPVPWIRSGAPPADIEGVLAERLSEGSRLVTHRSFLHGDNLGRLLSLLLVAGRADGSEVGPKDFVARLRGRALAPAAQGAAAAWIPVQVAAGPSGAGDALERDRVVRLVRVLGAAGVRVAFVVPPLAANARAALKGVVVGTATVAVDPNVAEERALPYRALFSDVAREAPVFDFASLTVPAAVFRDRSHLNAEGRRLYSQALGRLIAEAALLP